MQTVLAILGGGAGTALVGGIFTLIQWKLSRKAAREDRAAQVSTRELRALDRLVLDHPDNGGVLMQRGSNALYSPEVAGRGSIAVADFEPGRLATVFFVLRHAAD